MPRIEWDESFSVHHDEIDAQHRKWIEIYNRLDRVMEEGELNALKSITADTLQSMLEYARFHFKYEERYMQELGYPSIASHARVHKDFDNIIYQSYRDVLDGNIVLNTRLLKLVRSWLLNHILVEDKKYAQFAGEKEKGK